MIVAELMYLGNAQDAEAHAFKVGGWVGGPDGGRAGGRVRERVGPTGYQAVSANEAVIHATPK